MPITTHSRIFFVEPLGAITRRTPSRAVSLAFAGAAFCVASAMACLIPAQAAPNAQKGRQVYMHARCFACHGEMGYGGIGPRFRANRFLGMKDYVVGQILIGRGVMPSFAHALNDQQIAAVASYIRTSWGNQFGDISSSEVAKVRKEVTLHLPQGRPHLPPEAQKSNEPPTPPAKPKPPGQANLPNNTQQQ